MFTSSWIDFAGLVLPALLIMAAIALVMIRDPLGETARRVTRRVWCAQHGRLAAVAFREGPGPHGMMRIVQECPPRRRFERCGETCAVSGGPAVHTPSVTPRRMD